MFFINQKFTFDNFQCDFSFPGCFIRTSKDFQICLQHNKFGFFDLFLLNCRYFVHYCLVQQARDLRRKIYNRKISSHILFFIFHYYIQNIIFCGCLAKLITERTLKYVSENLKFQNNFSPLRQILYFKFWKQSMSCKELIFQIRKIILALIGYRK